MTERDSRKLAYYLKLRAPVLMPNIKKSKQFLPTKRKLLFTINFYNLYEVLVYKINPIIKNIARLSLFPPKPMPRYICVQLSNRGKASTMKMCNILY